jgi:DNA-directed RNA polymerase specialized sigma24 family protein
VKGLRERTIPTDFEYDLVDDSPSLETMLVEDDEARQVIVALRTLGEDCQQLLRLLAVEPALSYEEISEIMGRPVGSLGPTRSRCLERLKAALSSRISGAGTGSLDQGEDDR